MVLLGLLSKPDLKLGRPFSVQGVLGTRLHPAFLGPDWKQAQLTMVHPRLRRDTQSEAQVHHTGQGWAPGWGITPGHEGDLRPRARRERGVAERKLAPGPAEAACPPGRKPAVVDENLFFYADWELEVCVDGRLLAAQMDRVNSIPFTYQQLDILKRRLDEVGGQSWASPSLCGLHCHFLCSPTHRATLSP